ncbi:MULTISPECIES: DoxX-like family protein [unclassified Moraxella]|uniref:DoxX-like family protein n=1 Tax=unclassified Moraxella TaxID=2685852 RepID=UPI003AF80B57
MKIPNYLYYSLAILWAYSGIVPLLFAQSPSLALLHSMGFSDNLAWLLFIGASGLDIAFAVLILSKFRHNPLLWGVQFFTIIIYNLLILLLLPNESLWQNLLHPFAPVIKNLPILAIIGFLWQTTVMSRKVRSMHH